MDKNHHSTYGNFEFFIIGNNHDSPDRYYEGDGPRIGDEHSEIDLLELRRDGSSLRFEPLKGCALLGPPVSGTVGRYHHYFSYFIGIAQKYNNVIACGFTGGTFNDHDLFTTEMTHEWFGSPFQWNYSQLKKRYHTISSSRELNESRFFLPHYDAPDYAKIGYPRRGLMTGLFVEGTGAVVAGTEDETNVKKQVRVMFNPEPYHYGSSSGANNDYEWIAQARIGNIDNASGASGYSDFTSIAANYQLGYVYSVALIPGFGSTPYDEYWKIWIDFNGDGDFYDANENVFSGHGYSTVSGFVSIPSEALPGPTRMRLSMKWDQYPEPYEVIDFGEVEDYTVYIDKESCGST